MPAPALRGPTSCRSATAAEAFTATGDPRTTTVVAGLADGQFVNLWSDGTTLWDLRSLNSLSHARAYTLAGTNGCTCRRAAPRTAAGARRRGFLWRGGATGRRRSWPWRCWSGPWSAAI